MENDTPPSPPSDDSLDIPLADDRDKQEGLDEELANVSIIDDDQLRDIQRARDSHKRLQRKRRRYEISALSCETDIQIILTNILFSSF